MSHPQEAPGGTPSLPLDIQTPEALGSLGSILQTGAHPVERHFCVDRDSIRRGELVFNRTATLRDTWAKIEQAMSAGG